MARLNSSMLRGVAFLWKLVAGVVLLAICLSALALQKTVPHSLTAERKRKNAILLGHAFHGSSQPLWWAAASLSSSSSSRASTPFACAHCVLDPLVYPDTYCSPHPEQSFNGSGSSTRVCVSWVRPFDLWGLHSSHHTCQPIRRPIHTTLHRAPNADELAELEQYEDQASPLDILEVIQSLGATTIGVIGDSFMQQALDAMACELRRLGMPERAGFMRWEVVREFAGRFDEDTRPRRYNWAGPHGDALSGPRWYVLSQMYFNAGEVQKVLDASDVAIVNYGLHCA